MYCLTINDPTVATRVRPRELYHNELAQVITEIQIYQMSYMFGNKDMLNFETGTVRGIITISIAHVRFIVESIPFDQEPKYNGFVTRWYEVGDSYSPPSASRESRVRTSRKVAKKQRSQTVELIISGKHWEGQYDPHEIFADAFITFLGLGDINED